MKSVVKIPLEVTSGQAAILDSQSKIANWLYNKLLEQANALRQQYRATQDQQVGLTLYTQRGLRNLIPGLKVKHPFLKAVYSSVLKNAALRLSKAIRDYQDGKHGRRANVVNWPRFRAWKRKWFSLQYDEPWKGYALAGRTLTLILGQDAAGNQLSLVLALAEPLPHWVNHQHIHQCRIVKEGQLYCVVFSVDRLLPTGKPLSPDKVVAASPQSQKRRLCGRHRWQSHRDPESLLPQNTRLRDENAARNGLNRVLKALGLPCSGRREVSSRRAWRFNGLGLTSGGR